MKTNLKISYPASEKVYMEGAIHPDIRVAMRRVRQMPTVSIRDGVRVEEPNSAIYIYDTSGPYGDPNIEIDLERGLPHLRKARYEFRWKDQFNLSLDPERALEYYKTSNNVGGRYCTMCGPNFCAMKISHTLCEE